MPQKNSTALQVMRNIEYEVETLNQHIQLTTKDSTVLFMIGEVKSEDSRTKRTGALLGNYEQSIALLSNIMLENEEVSEFIFDAVKSYIRNSASLPFAVIKIPTKSKLANLLQNIISKHVNNKNDKENHEN